NKHFSQKKYNDAIQCYNSAIQQSEKAIYYVNRALCYIKLKQWDKVYLDSRHALDLDSTYIKANCYLGQYYLEQQRYDEAIYYFKYSLDLCKLQNKNFGDEINRLLRIAQKNRFLLIENKRIDCEIELQTYLKTLIMNDKEKRIQQRIENYIHDKEQEKKGESINENNSNENTKHYVINVTPREKTMVSESMDTTNRLSNNGGNSSDLPLSKQYLSKAIGHHNTEISTTLGTLTSGTGTAVTGATTTTTAALQTIGSNIIDHQLEEDLKDIERVCDKSLSEMNRLFNELDQRRQKREIPEYLTCKLCYDIMRDPVITPYGITYCRGCIEENL
ncbi:unnamed protein product, partial [Didymodactylos carnosus]